MRQAPRQLPTLRKFHKYLSTRASKLNHMLLFQGMSKILVHRYNCLLNFQRQLWKIRSNILTLIPVLEVNSEPSDFLKYRGSYETSNHFKCTLYEHLFISNEGKFETTPKKLEL